MTTLSRIALLASLLASAPAHGGGVEILATFPGASGPGPKDCPDNSGAVGPHHVVDFTNASVVIHDKRTGEVVRQMTQTEFWKAAHPKFDLPVLNDPRLLYDPLSGAGSQSSPSGRRGPWDTSPCPRRQTPPGAGRESCSRWPPPTLA